MTKNRLFTVTALVLSACSSTPIPEQHLYTLSTDPANVTSTKDFEVGISRVSVAPYLRRNEILVQTGDQEIRPARYHGWAEPLAEGVKRYVRDALSRELGANVDTDLSYQSNWTQDITISIDRLHGELDGDVYLDATYTISTTGHEIRKRFTADTSQSRPGYPALVEAQQALLGKFTTAIRISLKQIP